MKIRPGISELEVRYHGRLVGRLALGGDGCQLFQYAPQWLRDGWSISPLSLPLEARVFQAKRHPLSGMFGVFADSLPDGWGQLLLDRALAAHGVNVAALSTLDRLSLVGESGMGALEYVPAGDSVPGPEGWDFDELSRLCMEILQGRELAGDEDVTALDTLYRLGGSSGGARPKVLVEYEGQPWIVKFASHVDPPDIGRQEFEISQLARQCALDIPPTALFPSEVCAGYFGVQRFDRVSGGGQVRKVYMVSAAGLLETSHRESNLDYSILFRLTRRICPQARESEQLFRLMCFNVLIGNRDDHAKNFAFLFDEVSGQWHLSPAYDMTRSPGVMGQHSITVRGKVRDITDEDLVTQGTVAGLPESWCRKVLRQMLQSTATYPHPAQPSEISVQRG